MSQQRESSSFQVPRLQVLGTVSHLPSNSVDDSPDWSYVVASTKMMDIEAAFKPPSPSPPPPQEEEEEEQQQQQEKVPSQSSSSTKRFPIDFSEEEGPSHSFPPPQQPPPPLPPLQPPPPPPIPSQQQQPPPPIPPPPPPPLQLPPPPPPLPQQQQQQPPPPPPPQQQQQQQKPPPQLPPPPLLPPPPPPLVPQQPPSQLTQPPEHAPPQLPPPPPPLPPRLPPPQPPLSQQQQQQDILSGFQSSAVPVESDPFGSVPFGSIAPSRTLVPAVVCTSSGETMQILPPPVVPSRVLQQADPSGFNNDSPFGCSLDANFANMCLDLPSLSVSTEPAFETSFIPIGTAATTTATPTTSVSAAAASGYYVPALPPPPPNGQQQQKHPQQQHHHQLLSPSNHLTINPATTFSFITSPPPTSSFSSPAINTVASDEFVNSDVYQWAANSGTLSNTLSPSSTPAGLNMLYSAPPKPRSASVRRYKNRVDQDLQDEMRPRTSSMPTKNTWRKPQLLGPPPWSGEYTDDLFVRDSDDIPYSNEADSYGQCSPTAAYRMRSFTTTSKGLVNRGDSLVTNYSWISPNNSVSDYPSGSNSTSSLTSAQAYKVLVLGAPSVGKAAIIQQMMTSEYMGWKSTDSYEGDVGSKYVSVLLDKEETMLDITKIQGTESLPSGVDYDAYVLVFGIDDKQSFNDAVDFLYRFRKEDVHNCLVVLVANKVDLVRNRVITTEEAKGIASAYDCKYIESSTILNHHLDELLVCLVSEIRSRQRKSRSSHEKTSQKSRSPVSPKHLFNKLFRRGSISKSYENLAED